MKKGKSFSEALSSGTAYVPPPVSKPSAWESYIMQELKHLQEEVKELRQLNNQKDSYIRELQAQVGKVKLEQDQKDTCIHELQAQIGQVKLEQEQAKPIEEIAWEQVKKVNLLESDYLTDGVISVIKEQEKREDRKNCIRIGGLSSGWDRETVDAQYKDDYILDTDILKEQLSKAVPFVDLGDPFIITVHDTQATIKYMNRREKIEVLRQTKSLQGTKVWISDELTPIQLKHKATELAKVKEARKMGKWAVYREGKAIIRDFRTPLQKK